MKDDVSSVAELRWFHAIDFGPFASSGRFKPGCPQNITLYGVFDLLQCLDLSNASLLDIGTYDGLVAFGSKKLGARRVVGVDSHRNRGFLLARKLLGYSEHDIEYIPGIQMSDLSTKYPLERFDVIVCAGVIYHMLFPMQAFTTTRRLLADGGYMLLESTFDDRLDKAVLYFNGVEEIVNEPFTYFVPTPKALIGMANLSGYQVKATRVLTKPKRMTLLLKAVTRTDLINDVKTPPFIVQMLKRDTCDNEFRFKNLESDAARRPAQVRAKLEILLAREIDAENEVVTFPYHPPHGKLSFGSTRFEMENGNTKIL